MSVGTIGEGTLTLFFYLPKFHFQTTILHISNLISKLQFYIFQTSFPNYNSTSSQYYNSTYISNRTNKFRKKYIRNTTLYLLKNFF